MFLEAMELREEHLELNTSAKYDYVFPSRDIKKSLIFLYEILGLVLWLGFPI